MRKEYDFRPDHAIKLEMLETLKVYYNCNPKYVFDDRDSVVKMWRDQGLTCLQVAEGNF